MAGPEDRMASGEIEERLTSIERGDKVRVVVDGVEYVGEANNSTGDVRDGGVLSTSISTDSGNVNIRAPICPAEPNVGIPNPYIEEIQFEKDGKKVLVDALQIWSDKYDDWL